MIQADVCCGKNTDTGKEERNHMLILKEEYIAVHQKEEEKDKWEDQE